MTVAGSRVVNKRSSFCAAAGPTLRDGCCLTSDTILSFSASDLQAPNNPLLPVLSINDGLSAVSRLLIFTERAAEREPRCCTQEIPLAHPHCRAYTCQQPAGALVGVQELGHEGA